MGDDKNTPGSYEDFLHKVYTATSPAESQKLYDEWASQYDAHLSGSGYTSPRITVDAVVNHLDRSPLTTQRLAGKLTILDAGCGTGQVGVCFQEAAKSGKLDGLDLQIDGNDLSPGMLKVARASGAYRELNEADLSKPLTTIPDETYDIITCVGTLTKGHVGPQILKSFIRIAKRGWGLIGVTVVEEIWESGGYASLIVEEEKYGRVEIMRNERFAVWSGDEEKQSGRVVVLRRKYLAQEIAHAGIGA
ncbi:Williams-Beuren syndrome chromosomal region 27 protein [Cyphellophora attinorum]|uniref:Williams-Beuren syndrome chromosomal region 27 protein n=1 Tax=Cyphellophora attinorum TaxID=1664694 RepID=A0A0N1HHP3_9EURO|nr:Williams-Beuren syndrome chromosomal region 27 protein [Phialophora attinorum]KPI35372.1 Williams-Beuren syndrome chromosomal region 27 protein [Phialophora attinorum]